MKKPICCGLLLVVILSACNLLVPADASVISGIPCAPPCWQNLTPGESTLDDVYRFLNGLRKSEQKTIKMSSTDDGIAIFSWDSARNGGERRVYVNVNEKRLMLIEIHHPEFDLRLGAVVDHFGPPDSMYAEVNNYADGSLYIIQIYYSDQGLVFESVPSVEDMGRIRSDMSVNTIYYFAPGDLANFFGPWNADFATKHIVPNVRPWFGFTE